jgi:DNA topoisomerase IB
MSEAREVAEVLRPHYRWWRGKQASTMELARRFVCSQMAAETYTVIDNVATALHQLTKEPRIE